MSNLIFSNLYEKINNGFDKMDELSSVIKSGVNTLSHDITVERLILDESWINAIDHALVSIETIIRSPKKSIKDESLIVAVEKANKVNQRSIQHLANHSENIKYANDREIMPSRVLTSIVDENLAIYENRFLITLINKVSKFVDDRHKIVKKIIGVTCHDNLTIDSRFKLGRSNVKCSVSLEIEDAPIDNLNMKNSELMGKVESIKRRLSQVKKSDFFIMLRNAKPVFAPIVKTNILTKNVDYNNAYKLWIFMAGYAEEGFSLEVEHKNLPCDEEYGEDLLNVIATLTATSVVNHNIRREAFNNIDFRKKIDKKFRVVTKFNYKPNFAKAPLTVGDEVINEYYFQKMRAYFRRESGIDSGNIIVREKNINMPFAKLYRSVTKVSSELFKDVLTVECKPSRKVNPTKYDCLTSEFNRQKEVFRRAQILSRLKAQELTKTYNAESKELIKLEKIKFELENQGEKLLNKRITDQMKRVASRKIASKEKSLVEKAKQYESELQQGEMNRQLSVTVASAGAVMTKKEERERKLLTMLKKKYENNDGV